MAIAGNPDRLLDDPLNRTGRDVLATDDSHTVLLNKISWGAVFAGVVVALVVHTILNMLGVGIGAASLNPLTGGNPSAATFSMAAAAWWVVTGILAAFAGGIVAGRLSGRPKESTAGWHGLISWAATTLVIVFLVSSALGSVVGGAMNIAGSALGGMGKAAGAAAGMAAPELAKAQDPFGAIEQRLRASAGGQDPAALRDAAVASLRAVVSGDQAQVAEARERAADAWMRAQVAAGQATTIEEARTQIADLERRYRESVAQVEQRAREAADAAAKVVSRSALLAAFSLLLGAFAAWIGGKRGTVRPFRATA